MIARLLISKSLQTRVGEIEKILEEAEIPSNHPDLLYFAQDSKLGIEQARQIKGHFSLKPYQTKGRAVVLEDASNLTQEAQNALLKTLEEPPAEALLILAAPSDAKFLPTILSRCQIIRIQSSEFRVQNSEFEEDIERLLEASIEERFEYIEKLKAKEEFLLFLVRTFRLMIIELPTHARSIPKGRTLQEFLQELLEAEKWANQNVNIRAILEYLMLVMPNSTSQSSSDMGSV